MAGLSRKGPEDYIVFLRSIRKQIGSARWECEDQNSPDYNNLEVLNEKLDRLDWLLANMVKQAKRKYNLTQKRAKELMLKTITKEELVRPKPQLVTA